MTNEGPPWRSTVIRTLRSPIEQSLLQASHCRRVRRASWHQWRWQPAVFVPSGVSALLNTLLALLAVLAVMTAHAVYKLVRLPFRLVRGLFRHSRKPAHVTAG